MLLLSRSVFIMAPRTGTTWARQAMRNAGVRYKEWGAKHSLSFPDGQQGRPSASSFRFTFVRDPAAWVRSRWTLGPWEDELRKLWSPDPEEFARRVDPTRVQIYFEKYTDLCQSIGKTETLADDLVKALEQAGETFNERDLRRTPRMNEAGPDYRLQLGGFYEMLPEQWCLLPADDILRMPTDLLDQLPDAALDRLNPEELRRMLRRLQREASPVKPRDVPVRLGSE